MNDQKQIIEIRCNSCTGSGVIHGFAEPEGVAVVCINCDGSGSVKFEYVPFTGRVTRTGIEIVRRSWGITGPEGDSVTYQEFLEGKMPPPLDDVSHTPTGPGSYPAGSGDAKD